MLGSAAWLTPTRTTYAGGASSAARAGRAAASARDRAATIPADFAFIIPLDPFGPRGQAVGEPLAAAGRVVVNVRRLPRGDSPGDRLRGGGSRASRPARNAKALPCSIFH